MSEKRRDSKNRILRNGESQRPDGRYRFKYKDVFGKDRDVYSWRLDEKDPTPKGKKHELSLREKEKQIERDFLDGVIPQGGKFTVLSLCEKYISLKVRVKKNTYFTYKSVVNLLQTDEFGKTRIDQVKQSDAKSWMVNLQKTKNKGYSSLYIIKCVLGLAFKMAFDDGFIRRTPFDFDLEDVISKSGSGRSSLTQDQEEKFLDFIKNDSCYYRYYESIYVLFNTGLRISEFCGLTIDDIDFESMTIKVDHQLQRTSDMEYMVDRPKSEKGIRFVPMTNKVAECFKNIINRRITPVKEPVIDGFSGFVFLDRNGQPTVARHWQNYIQRIRQKYNKTHDVPIPEVTPHVCRHTFCSKMARSGINPKTLQYIMGHADISLTLNTYTHVTLNDVNTELHRVIGENQI